MLSTIRWKCIPVELPFHSHGSISYIGFLVNIELCLICKFWWVKHQVHELETFFSSTDTDISGNCMQVEIASEKKRDIFFFESKWHRNTSENRRTCAKHASTSNEKKKNKRKNWMMRKKSTLITRWLWIRRRKRSWKTKLRLFRQLNEFHLMKSVSISNFENFSCIHHNQM